MSAIARDAFDVPSVVEQAKPLSGTPSLPAMHHRCPGNATTIRTCLVAAFLHVAAGIEQ